MKAILSKVVGGPETLVLEEVPDPVPGPKQVLLAVKACGVNFPDTLIIEDRYQFRPPRPFSPGGEVAGVVEAVGPEVKSVKVGDRVIGSTGHGGMAEKVVVDEFRCIPMAENMPFDEASAFILTYGTSHHALKDRGQLKPGETLLVLGAAGGVGLAAVELGKAMGARVIGAVSSQEKADLVKARGADDVVIYPQGPFDRDGRRQLAELFKKACGEKGADVIYDAVGGDYAEAALRAIAWEGRFLVVGFPAGIPSLPLNLTLLKGCQVVGVFWGAWVARNPQGFAASVAELMDFYRRGLVKPYVSARFPLERAGEAIAHLAARKALGKVVVVME
ncbi:NADPH:quinone oxidoreductase family protein [Camelimonas abortus]|uniref:NADPH:quinone oxidoreductase family protein n=1 Tax=Camelimonas abortus TaxID=1017184 RepID=A0ABV7LBZ3_9HYPH